MIAIRPRCRARHNGATMLPGFDKQLNRSVLPRNTVSFSLRMSERLRLAIKRPIPVMMALTWDGLQMPFKPLTKDAKITCWRDESGVFSLVPICHQKERKIEPNGNSALTCNTALEIHPVVSHPYPPPIRFRFLWYYCEISCRPS